MLDRWYYLHAGKTLGPVTAAQLRQLAGSGRLEPNDPIWPEGRNQKEAVPAQAAIPFGRQTTPLENKPDWLDDVRAAFSVEEKSTPAPPSLDWLDDVRATEEKVSEFLPLEWDAEPEVLEVVPAVQEPAQAVEQIHELRESDVIAEPDPCRLILGSATTRGRVRDRNEDSLLVQQLTWCAQEQRHEVALIVVADGMGGHQAGDRASGLVIRAVGEAMTPLLSAALSGEPAEPDALAKALERGLQEANRLVQQKAKEDAACQGMGSTAVALLLWDGHASIRLVGDCRVYHQRAGQLMQVTRDQTLVARMVELGQLTPEEAARHPRRNEVTQAIGRHSRLEPARYEVALQRGDWLLACCDGLYAHVTDAMLQEALNQPEASAPKLAQRLIERANQGGGSDNCTVVAVQCV